MKKIPSVMLKTRWAIAVGVTLVMATVQARGQGPILPMLVATPDAIQDEFGKNLEGDALDPTGDRVEILRITGTGPISPPNMDGSPGPDSEIIDQGVSRIGNLVAEGLHNAGMFAVAIASNQPPPGTKLCVRVFNADTTAGASFYGDSAPFTVSSTRNVYLVNIDRTDKPLDPGDDDGDGVNNSYEKSYGSNSASDDSDGDGMSDLDEHLAGTDLTDPGRYLKIEQIAPSLGDAMAVTWQSVSGRCYQVEYTDDDLAQAPVFLPVGDPVMAHDDFHTIDDVDGQLHTPRHYRVWALDASTSCE